MSEILVSSLNREENKINCCENMKEKVSTDPAKVKIKKFEMSFKGKDLCVDASLIIADGKRYGLIGLDSCGKTALLKHIEKGALHIPSDMDVLYWKPDIVDDELEVFDAVLKASNKCADLLEERKKLKAEQKKGNCEKEVNERLAQLWEELLMIDPESTPACIKAGNILSGLGFLSGEEYKTVKNISENLKKRASLARALFLEPALLILDEPTIELDLDATIWLGNYLQDYTKTLIVVSQDRCFLDKICNEIIYFDQQNTCYYKGNYSVFEKKFLKRQKKKKGELGDAGVKTQTGALTRDRSQNETKMDNNEEGRASVQLLQKPEFSFCDPVYLKRSDFVYLMEITFGYGKKKPIFKDLCNGINYRSRVAILGPSRAGKSTLLRLLNNELCPQKGKLHLEAGTKIGWFGENSIRKLPGHESPLQYIYKKAMDQKDVKEKDLKKKVAEKLSGLGLVDRSHTTKMEDLSDSEKARVALAELCVIPHDGLLMDEPTRYLDIDMIDGLADAINRFNGGLWMVTNNEYLIRETECELGFIEDRDMNYVIDFDDYKRKLLLKYDEPIRGPFVYKRRTSSKIVTAPKLISNSVIIENYIKNNSSVDPSIREIGKYRIVFEEGARNWHCYPPTLGTRCRVTERTKETCQEAVCEEIEIYIELLINNGTEVPPPP